MGADQRGRMSSKFEDYNADVKEFIGIDYSDSTWTKYDRSKRFAREFIRWNTSRRYSHPAIKL
jgi:hypothetical protein